MLQQNSLALAALSIPARSMHRTMHMTAPAEQRLALRKNPELLVSHTAASTIPRTMRTKGLVVRRWVTRWHLGRFSLLSGDFPKLEAKLTASG